MLLEDGSALLAAVPSAPATDPAAKAPATTEMSFFTSETFLSSGPNIAQRAQNGPFRGLSPQDHQNVSEPLAVAFLLQHGGQIGEPFHRRNRPGGAHVCG